MIDLIEKLQTDREVVDTLTLSHDQRQKSRQRVHLDSGREAAVLLPPGTTLCDGDRLLSAEGVCVAVSAAQEAVSTARSEDASELARACYHLGNRHVALQVGSGWLRYQPDHVLDAMVRGLGLTVTHDSARFEPERGAYHQHPHGRDGGAQTSSAAHSHHEGKHHH